MPDPLDRIPGRLVALLSAALLAVAAIGFATGTSPSSYRAKRAPLPDRPHSESVAPARTHAELETRPWTGGVAASGWEQSKRIAAEAAAAEAESEALAPEALLAARAERRAFDGAPPVIPHPVRSGSASECLACHADGFVLGARRATSIPHAAYASCTQCHVSAAAPFALVPASPAALAESRWTGLPAPREGKIAYSGAPPAVPHPTLMRENCEACHGAGAHAALRTPHPDRRSCLQCHPATGGRGEQASR